MHSHLYIQVLFYGDFNRNAIPALPFPFRPMRFISVKPEGLPGAYAYERQRKPCSDRSYKRAARESQTIISRKKSKTVWYQLLKPDLSPGRQPARLHSRALFPPVLYKNIEFIEYSV